jgi:hypothetical protein
VNLSILFVGLEKLFGLLNQTSPIYQTFTDSLGNFSISYPNSWSFDEDTIVSEGKYTVCFESSNKKAKCCISVDTSFTNSDFISSTRKKFESPTSGTIGTIALSKFRNFSSIEKTFNYELNGKNFGKITAFKSKNVAFEIALFWPENNSSTYEKIFEKMIKSLQF